MIDATRRTFLGFLAALAAGNGDGENGGGGVFIEGQKFIDDDYVETDCGSIPGHLSHVGIEAGNDGGLSIGAVNEEGSESWVDLVFTAAPVDVTTSYKPDEARELAARIMVAADAAEGKVQ